MALPRSDTRMMARRSLAVLVAAATLALASAPAETSAAGAVDRYTPLLQSVMSKPRWFKDGRAALESSTS